MDELKNIFINNPQQYELPEGHMTRFGNLLDKKLHSKVFLLHLSTGIAAASIILFSLIYFIVDPKVKSNDLILGSANEETIESEYYLRNEIANKMSIIHSFKVNKKTNSSLFNDIDDLDESLIKLRDDLKESPNDQRIINAVINTYRIKLEALDTILNILNKNS